MPDTVEGIEDGAFEDCISLLEVGFSKVLKKIGKEAFSGCKSLPILCLPLSLESIESKAFNKCTKLQNVIFQASTSVAIDRNAFQDCTSLVTVSLPDSVNADSDAFVGCDQLLVDGSHDTLRRRFAALPIHQLCYTADICTHDDLLDALNGAPDRDSVKDCFGMTPFHVLACSSTLRLDFLDSILSHFAWTVLQQRDVHGRTFLDYVLQHKHSNKIPFMQRILRVAVVHPLSAHGYREFSGLLSHMVDEITTRKDDTVTESSWLEMIFKELGYFMRRESQLLLGLALWNLKMKDCEKQDSEVESDYRENCRVNYQSAILRQHVMQYFWDTDDKFSIGLAAFPLYTPTQPEAGNNNDTK